MKITSPEIENYCKANSSPVDPICDEIQKYTFKNVDFPQMVIGTLEASLLKQFILASDAKRVLEFGTFTGYSALAMASVLPQDGELISLDISEETTKIAQSFWNKSPHGKKITSMIGQAKDSLHKLSGKFDFIFIDADKENYLTYFKASLEILSEKGTIILDNMLWSGDVLNQNSQSPSTLALQEVTRYISQLPNIEFSLLPVRDGMMVVRRKI